MAYYASLVSVVQLLKDITLHHRYPNFLPHKHQLHVSLYEKFNLVLQMLDDYSPKDHQEKTNVILERRIRDASDRALDMIESRISTTLLDHILLEKSTSRVERLHWHLGSTFQKPLDHISKKKYYRDLEKLKAEVDSILEELMRIKVGSNTVHRDLQPNSFVSVEASTVPAPSGKNTILVFHENLRTTIKAQLCGVSSKLEVISILGMGGLGKTTLARNIFDDKLTHDIFDYRVWVTVSRDYQLKYILLAIVNSLNINKGELDGDRDGVLQQYLYQHLYGRRYLIIMDDVWEAKFWDDVKWIFPDNSNGSRIIITTRLSNVADYVSSPNFHHKMQFLDQNQSWTLLRQKVFAQEYCPKELEIIGKLIAKKCGGLPLEIVVIAGVLSNVKREQHEWENVLRKVSSTAIDQNDEHLSKILSWSYNHLPHHLKPCFLYLGGYPEDHKIRISKLIRLWVAEGFIKPIESKSLEEAGEEYFNDLINRNLVLLTRKKFNGKFKFCIIHDVLRDLCLKKALDENFLLYAKQKDDLERASFGNVRRVYVQDSYGYPSIIEYIKNHGSHVRSIINCSHDNHPGNHSSSIASGCKLLRILDSRDVTRTTDFEKITEFVHLRYLKLNLDYIDPILSGISHLQNLQTLIIDSCKSLPSEIWKMPQLRHVMSKAGVTLPPIPYDEVRITDGVPLLGSLETLSSVRSFKFTRDAIEMVPNLKKLGFRSYILSVLYRLYMLYRGNQIPQIWEDHELSNLIQLRQLETLYISFGTSVETVIIPLPENFAFPSTLIKVTRDNCNLPWKDMSAVGSLPNLQILKLREKAFLGEEWEPIEGEFLKLKFLEMTRLCDLKYWRAETNHFPRLEQLHIGSCFALEEIPLEIGDILTLRLITLDFGYQNNSSLESSALEIHQQQKDAGNEYLQIRFFA